MKISLITCTYNSAETLQSTFDSVKLQNHPDLEYIVIDGNSKDATNELIEANRGMINHYVSEPDKGIYDAMNKGLKMATGEVVGFLHSDDFFASEGALSIIAGAFENPAIDASYGNLVYVDRLDTSRIIRKWKSKPYRAKLFYQGWMPAHPTFYLRRKHYEQFGYYDTSFRISADYELMLRMLLKHNLKPHFIDETLVKMRVGGESNNSLKNRWLANREDTQAWQKNGLKPGTLTRWQKPLSKLTQFLK